MVLITMQNLLGLVPPSTPFFPACSQVGKDIARLILDNITDGDLARMSEVNKRWNHFIQEVPALNNRLIRNACLFAARAFNIDDNSCFEPPDRKALAAFMLATVDPRHDFTEAKRAAKEDYHYPSQAFQRIVRWEAYHDPVAAMGTALDHSNIPELPLEIVNVLVKSDLVEAQALTEDLANLYQDPAVFARALIVIAKASDQNFTAAKAAAERIEDQVEKINVMLEIAEVDPQVDVSALKAQAISLPPWSRRYNAKGDILIKIAKLEAKLNPDTAKKTVRVIHSDMGPSGDDYLQSLALLAIVEVEAMIDPTTAKDTAKCIIHHNARSLAVVAIVKAEALLDVEAAEATAQKMFHNSKALVEIVRVMVRQSRAKALITANMIEDDYCRTLAHLEITKWDPDPDFTTVKAAAEKVVFSFGDNPKYCTVYNKALWKIIKEEVIHNTNSAKITSSKIQHDYYRFKALLEIAKVANSRSGCPWTIPLKK